MVRNFIFKPSLSEVKIDLRDQSQKVEKWASETSLRGVDNGLVRLVSEEVENGFVRLVRNSILKTGLREVKNWLARLVSEVQKMGS